MSPYTPQTWNDHDITKPVNAVRMGVIETGVSTAQGLAETVDSAVAGIGYICPAPTGVAATDTAAIQAKIDAASAAGGGVVLLRAGAYATNATLNYGQNIRVVGRGNKATTINYSGSSYAVLFGRDSETIENDQWTGLALEDLAIVGTASGLAGVRVRGCSRWSITRVRIAGFSTGVGIFVNGNTWIGKIDGGRITGCDRGISFRKNTAGGETSGNAVEICGALEVQDCATGIEIGHPTTTETGNPVAASVEIHGITVENCSVVAIWNVGGDAVGVHDCYVEDNPVMIRLGSTGGNTSQPVAFSCHDNHFAHTVNGTTFELLRGVRPKVRDNHVKVVAGTVIETSLTANVTLALIENNEEVGSITLMSGDTAANLHPRSRRNYAVATTASATTVTIPGGVEFCYISGTTTITSITAAADSRHVTLIFNGILTLTDGGNLFLNGNFVTTATDTITLFSDGANWIELCRSVN